MWSEEGDKGFYSGHVEGLLMKVHVVQPLKIMAVLTNDTRPCCVGRVR